MHSGSPTQKLSKLRPPLFFFWWRLHYIDMIDAVLGHWCLIQLLLFSPFLYVRGWDWKFQPSNQGWFPRQPAPILRRLGGLPSLLINITKDTFSKGFRSLVPGTRTKTKYIFLIINHNITLGHLIKGVSARFLHCNVSISPFHDLLLETLCGFNLPFSND